MTFPLQTPPVDPLGSLQPSDVSGIASIPFVMAGVDFIKAIAESVAGERKIPALVWPFVTYIVAMLLNCLIAALLGADPARGVLVGIVAGLGASGVRSQARAGMDSSGASDAIKGMMAEVKATVEALRQPLPPVEPEPPAVPRPIHPPIVVP
jgi:hypothetical protein